MAGQPIAMKKAALIASVIIIAALMAFFLRQGQDTVERETGTSADPAAETGLTGDSPDSGMSMETAFENMDVPWEVAFLPDESMIVTERPGNIKKLGADPVVIPVADVASVGEGGLLGMALHPEFSRNNWIYLYFTTRDGGALKNIVARYAFSDSGLADKKIIIDNIPAGSNHNGGRIAFGPDGYLYATTGDSGRSNLSQDTGSLAGKILRVKDDGSIPEDNPFSNAVYSYGHRNVQGIAWDEEGRLWATEHGRSGLLSGYDELNLIEKGVNYGWPEIQGGEERAGMKTPVINSGPSTTWAPSGAAFSGGSIFFAGLRGQALYEYNIGENKLTEHFKGEFGRLRQVAVAPDSSFILLTNNTDGRGTPRPGDDRIIKLSPDFFGKSRSFSENFSAPMDEATGRITRKTFGMFITPETSPVKSDKFRGFHTGVDWEIFPEELEKDVPVKAVCPGTFKLKKMASGYGGVAVQECELSGETVTVIYGHLNLQSVKALPGDKIKAGEVVGLLGAHESPETDGARKHLHLAIHQGKNIELLGYVGASEKLSAWIDPCLYGCCNS
jgi:glucose/arabinose dehydrogenase